MTLMQSLQAMIDAECAKAHTHGGYIAGEEKLATGEMSDDEILARAHEIAMRKLGRLSHENSILREENVHVTVAE